MTLMDVIIHWSSRGNPIPWTEIGCHDHNKHLYIYNQRHIAIGDETPFTTANNEWRPCRVYSYNATIMNKEGMGFNAFINVPEKNK